MIFRFVRTVAFYILRFLNFAEKYCITLLPAVLVLKYTWIHICSSNSYYIAPNVKAPVNQASYLAFALNIPYVNPNNSYI